MRWLRWIVGLSVVTVVAVLFGALVAAMGGGHDLENDAPDRPADINPVLYEAYVKAAAATSTLAPSCEGMRWQILAGIGQVESNQAAGREITDNGDVRPPIIGPRLDGSGTGGNHTPVYDTDGGTWDNDAEYDRAVGVLQFLPETWAALGRDADGNGDADPHNAFDNAEAAVVHLCGTRPRNLHSDDQLRDALYAYNRSWSYVDDVMRHIKRFDNGEDTDAPVADMDTIRARAEAFVAASAAGEPDPFFGETDYYRMCGRLAARIHGYVGSGYFSARYQWKAYLQGGTARPDEPPPPGALVFWDSLPHGHVAVYLGDGMVVSNDIYDDREGRQGGVYIAPIEDFSDGPWRLPYLGWAPPAYKTIEAQENAA